jgi:hypothetical protein
MVFVVMGVSNGGLQYLFEIQRQKTMNKDESTINVSQKKSLKLQESKVETFLIITKPLCYLKLSL